MISERGRGAVLVWGARVDAALEALLQATLAPPSGPETLFLTDQPPGSFEARIAVARRLGLNDSQVELAVQALRSVRNSFAHTTIYSSIGSVSSLALRRVMECSYDSRFRSNAVSAETMASALVLRHYILLITILVAFLEATAQQLQPFQPPVVMAFGGLSQ